MSIPIKPTCQKFGKCFARNKDGKCEILTEVPEELCSFQKPRRDVTNGKLYPFIPKK